jgi:SSS family solute:Na+ symporter
MLAKDRGIIVPEGASVLMVTIMQTTGPLVAAIVAGAIIAAIISTATSLISAISSNFMQDFDFSFSKKANVGSSQIISAVISVLGLLCSFWIDNIVDLLIFSYELSVSSLFVPIFVALFRKNGNPLSAGLSIGFGACSFVLCKATSLAIPSELFCLLMSFIGFKLGELQGQKSPLPEGSKGT